MSEKPEKDPDLPATTTFVSIFGAIVAIGTRFVNEPATTQFPFARFKRRRVWGAWPGDDVAPFFEKPGRRRCFANSPEVMHHSYASVIDELIANAHEHEADFPGPHSLIPEKHVALVTCMDSRIDTFRIFGLHSGEAHIIRNAGGIATDDVLRSLVLSQRFLKTREIVFLQHVDCGLQRFREDELRERITQEVGVEPPYVFGAFSDIDASVRGSIARVREHPFLPHRTHVRGFVYDVNTGATREVVLSAKEA
jgi:carbonic anhydrase